MSLHALLPDIDPNGLLEFSVVFTDRSLNHMSKAFQGVMRDVSATMKRVYHAAGVALVPGGGTFAMEAVARQFATGKTCIVLRNGWFSYRWSQIVEAGALTDDITVIKAQRSLDNRDAPFAPLAIDAVVAAIREKKPDVVFAPHVETSAGIILPDEYIRSIGAAVREHGGLFVLDCIASGCVWVDMQACNVDVLISAPQKGWSSTPCAGIAMLSDRAIAAMAGTSSNSFACDLKKWFDIMAAYEKGGHAYHATLPTDGLVKLREAIAETEAMGFDTVKQAQIELGAKARKAVEARGYKSVAAEGFKAPGVVVSYTDDPDIKSGAKFAALGVQTAAGVPLQCDEGPDFSTFRIGLFGLDKLKDVDATVARLEQALDGIATAKAA
jgi:aspartate aminotransferase-like enzyme